MVRSRRLLSLVLVAIGVDRRILKEWNGIEYNYAKSKAKTRVLII
jgi:hypothetical protein